MIWLLLALAWLGPLVGYSLGMAVGMDRALKMPPLLAPTPLRPFRDQDGES